jgi:FkbM family methyltransferase
MFKIILGKVFSRKSLNRLVFLRSLFYKFHSLNQIDEELSRLLKNRDGFYVEIGANDGLSCSNSLFFERKRGWSGVLVEPSPSTFEFLKNNRSPSNEFYNCACVSFDYKDDFIEFFYSNLMSTTVHSDEDLNKYRDHAESGNLFLARNEYLRNFRVPARTLESLLISSKAPDLMDFFSLDVEGNELEILKGLSHINYRFKYIVVETPDFTTISKYLLEKKYKFIKNLSPHDYLFKNMQQ